MNGRTCNICGSNRHFMKRCPKNLCYLCKGRGHSSSACEFNTSQPNKANTSSKPQNVDNSRDMNPFAKQMERIKFEKRRRYNIQYRHCRKCYETGHYAEACTNERLCRDCRKVHNHEMCPLRKCTVCLETGHHWSECKSCPEESTLQFNQYRHSRKEQHILSCKLKAKQDERQYQRQWWIKVFKHDPDVWTNQEEQLVIDH